MCIGEITKAMLQLETAACCATHTLPAQEGNSSSNYDDTADWAEYAMLLVLKRDANTSHLSTKKKSISANSVSTPS